MSTQLSLWFQSLSARDQRILRIGAAAAVVILLVGTLLPLQRNLAAARERVAAQREDLQWMQQMGPTLAAAGPGAAAAPPTGSLVVFIDTSARESGLAKALTGSQPTGSGGLRVQMEHADFNLLVGWMARLSSQNGIRIENASITGTDGAGAVNASIQLRAPELAK